MVCSRIDYAQFAEKWAMHKNAGVDLLKKPTLVKSLQSEM